MVPSAVINEAIVFITLLAMGALLRRTPKEKLALWWAFVKRNCLPVVILFMSIEKHLVSGLTSGGVKG